LEFYEFHLAGADLNGTSIEILEEPPTPVEFARLVHISRPVIIKGGLLRAPEVNAS